MEFWEFFKANKKLSKDMDILRKREEILTKSYNMELTSIKNKMSLIRKKGMVNVHF